MISQDFILLILNCKSYKDRAILQRKLWVNNLPYEIKHFYVIGDETLIDDHMFMDDVLYVKCKDDYISLPVKIISAIRAINTKYDYKYIFKTDDDQMLVNKSFFTELCKDLDKECYDYGGFIVDVKDHYTEYKSNQINKKIYLNACSYANGRFYLLSKKSCVYLSSIYYKFYDYIYEDYSIGYELGLGNPNLKVKKLEVQFDDFMDVDIYINNKYNIFTEVINSSEKGIKIIENFVKNNPGVILNVYITYSDSKYFENKLAKSIIDKVEFHAVNESVKLKGSKQPGYSLDTITSSVWNGCKATDKNFILVNSPDISFNMIQNIVVEMEKGYDMVCGKEYKESFVCAKVSVFTDQDIENVKTMKSSIYKLIEDYLRLKKNIKIKE
jgi:hypothetical protein